MADPSGLLAPFALVVDDSDLVRMAAVAILEDAGFRTFDAADSDVAMMLLAEHHAETTLLFTDVQMPGSRDGFAVAREAAKLYPHIAIVVASGETRPVSGDMPPGARFIGKPFSAEMVHAHLREILPGGGKPEQLQR